MWFQQDEDGDLNGKQDLNRGGGPITKEKRNTEPVFLNVYGAPELIPRNEFRQPM